MTTKQAANTRSRSGSRPRASVLERTLADVDLGVTGTVRASIALERTQGNFDELDLGPAFDALLELDRAERTDDLSRTAPKLELTGTMSEHSRFLLGAARISAVTTKIDALLRTQRVSNSAVLSQALANIKRDILVGLAEAKGAFDDVRRGTGQGEK